MHSKPIDFFSDKFKNDARIVVSEIVGIVALFMLCLPAFALVPVEGIIMGEARIDIQQDPLNLIFRDNYDRSQLKENKKVKLYHAMYNSGANLTESCGFYGPMSYSSTWREKQARRSMASTLQYIGLDTAIKAVAAYGRKLEMGPADFRRLSINLVKNYCSKNVTIFSLRNIEQSLQHYFDNPEDGLIPSIETSPFATRDFKNRTEKEQARSVEMEYAVKSFRSFCSWGGEVEDYRLMGPYLKNPFIMAFVIKNLLGIQDTFLEKEEKVTASKSSATVQVICEELICRKAAVQEEFEIKFPLSVGSSGLNTDLAKLYCHHFRYQDYSSSNAIPQVKKWIKDSELEDPVFETNFFISLMSGVPDPIFGTENYVSLPFITKSSIDERWNNWANDVLAFFFRDLMFEESLKVKTMPLRDIATIQNDGFRLSFSITLGELDRVLDHTDKLKASFSLKLSRNYLRQIRNKWNRLVNEADFESQKAHKQDIARYLNFQLQKKERLFRQRMWTTELGRFMADELLEQLLAYRGSRFSSYSDEMITVPVDFHYGAFALGYLRFRADVNADRLKFKY